MRDGEHKKFVDNMVQSAFYAHGFYKKGVPVLYVTERAVFKLGEKGLILSEIAPGVDLQKDILNQMDFVPEIPEGGPVLMDETIFHEKWGKLKEMIEAR